MLKQERDRTSMYYDMYKNTESLKDQLQAHSDSIEVVLARYKYLVDSLEVIVISKDEDIAKLNKGLEEALAEIEEYTYDENYIYLQGRYPTQDTLEFPFSGPQISMISREVITFDYTDSLYRQYIDISILQARQLDYKEEIINTLHGEKDKLNILAQDLYKLLADRDQALFYTEAELAKIKKARNMWAGGAIGSAGFLLLLLLLL